MIRPLLTALTALLCIWAMGTQSAGADHLSLEGGLNSGANFPAGSDVNVPYATLGFTGQLSYEVPHWGFGIRVLGSASNPTPFNIPTDPLTLNGKLSRRKYQLELLARYFIAETPDNRGWYLEFGFLGHETDFVNSEQVYKLPQSPDYTRVFLRGSGFTLGAGYRPRSGPWFYQLVYELTHYEKLEVTGIVNYLHPILLEAPLVVNSYNNTITFMVGLDVFGR